MAISSPRPATRPVEFRPDIQGLRAVAVLLVIGDHAGARWLPGGFVGVDVFFVISGYLITLLLLRQSGTTGRVRLGDFYARRARRILPAATLVIVAIMAYAAAELSLSRVEQLRKDGWWSAAFAANIHFARLRTDYFAQGPDPSPFQHYWSLAVEEQFYLVWPLLLAGVLVLVARRSGGTGSPVRALTALLIAVSSASLAWSVLRTAATPATTYYSSTARAWELAVGALLAVQEPRLAALGRRARWGLGGGGLVAIWAAAVLYDSGSAFPGWRALLPVLGAAAVITAGVAGEVGPGRLLSLAPLPWLGAISYSLYLWHWPILVLGPGYSPVLAGPRGTVSLLVITLVASVVSYRLVENPLRRSPLLHGGPRGLVLWPVSVAVVLLGMVAAQWHASALLEARMASPVSSGMPFSSGTTDRSGDRAPSTAPVAPQPSIEQRLADALRVADSGARVSLPLTNLPRSPHAASELPGDCAADSLETSTEVCPLGRSGAGRTMVVLGDSQANEWLPAIDRLGADDGFRVLPLIKFGCTPFDVPEVDGAGADYWECTEFRRWAAAYIARTHPQVVIVGSEATSDRMRATPGLTLSQTWSAGVSRLVGRLGRNGARVVVLADTPDLTFDPVDCLTAPHSLLEDCVGAPHEGLAAANGLTRAVAGRAGAGFIDTVALVCLSGRCPTVVDRTMTFMDYAHVSPAWSAALAGDFARIFRQQVGGTHRRP
jgi:peptidoglycan/LPS O-acetylase OafA/YrhL